MAQTSDAADKHSPFDPAVKMPQAVKDAVARANAAATAAGMHVPTAPTKDQAAPPVPAPGQLSEMFPQPVHIPTPTAQPAPAASAEPPRAALPAPPGSEPEPTGPVDWENRYKSAQGRVQKFSTELDLLKRQNQEMAQRLMEAQNQQAMAAASQPVERPVYITPEEEKSWGPEYVDMVRRAAREIVEPEVQWLARQQEAVQQQIVQTKTEKVYDALDREIPEWANINHSPDFARWLDLPDPLSGAIRRGMLNNAMRAADAPRVAKFFKSFVSEAAGSQPAPQAPQSAPQQPPAPYVDLRSIAAPDRASSGSAATHVPPEKPVVTRAQIKAFYSDAGRRSYVGREADRLRDEAILAAAINEGRVR